MILVDNCAVATVDAAGTEYGDGHVVVGDDGRIVAVGTGHAGRYHRSMRRIDGTGCLLTPGLVNSAHHLYQWVTRGLALDAAPAERLSILQPIWARLDPESVGAAVGAGLGWLALSGCTTSADHLDIALNTGPGSTGPGSTGPGSTGPGSTGPGSTGPGDTGPGYGGEVLAAEIEAARQIGLRLHVAHPATAIDAHHDPSPDSMLRIAVAPGPSSTVLPALTREAADLARRAGVRLYTPLASSADEVDACVRRNGCTPVEWADSLGWLGDDVWLAHGVHLDKSAVARLAATGTGVAHCPSADARLGAGVADVRGLLAAGVPVGLGVGGAAANDASQLGAELRQALYAARQRGGPAALNAREALRLGTLGGARCLGRQDDIGSIEVGKLADLVLWRLDGLAHEGIDDRVAALVFGPPAPVELALVGGAPVVERGELVHADQQALARRVRRAHRRLLKAAR